MAVAYSELGQRDRIKEFSFDHPTGQIENCLVLAFSSGIVRVNSQVAGHILSPRLQIQSAFLQKQPNECALQVSIFDYILICQHVVFSQSLYYASYHC